MKPDHVSAELLEAMATGERPVAEVALEALQHLGGEHAPICPSCRETLRSYPPGRIAERAGGAYSEALARAAARVEDLAAEYRAAGALLEELQAESHLGRAVAKLMSPRFATFGLCMLLTEQAAAAIPDRPERGRDLALMAVVVARRVDRHRYRAWPALPADLLCVSRTRLADALQATGALEEAAEELQLAEQARRLGSGDGYYRAELELVRSRLLIASGRAREAREVASGIEAWARRRGATREDFAWEAVRVVAEAARAEGEPGEAADELSGLVAALRAKTLWSREHRVRLELVAALAEAARFDEAWKEIGRIRIVSEGGESSGALARQGFWEGAALCGMGRLQEGTEALDRARQGLIAEGLGLEALRASLHLLEAYCQSGEEARLEELAAELPDLLTAGGIPGWAASHLVVALQGLASVGDGARRAEAIGAARADLDQGMQGARRRGCDPVQ